MAEIFTRRVETVVSVVPLPSNWTLWFKEEIRGEETDDHCSAWSEQQRRCRCRGRSAAADWGANLRALFDVSTAAEFLGAYGRVKLPSALPAGATYYFFRRGVRPVWEDEPNRGGGSWRMLMDGNGNELNMVWTELLYMLVTDGLTGYVCGAACAVKRGGTHKVSVWTVRVTAGNREHIARVGRFLRAAIQDVYRGVKSVKYETHEKTSSSSSSVRDRCVCPL